LININHAILNYFVAKANQDLFFRQIGKKLDNCSLVHNPPNQSALTNGAWPEADVELSLACVGRLDVNAKGQDILFEVLARPQWQSRSVRIHLYGSGVNLMSLRRHAETLKITDKIVFEGHVTNIGQLWSRHHALVMPSRYEGTPLALIEAMHCSRPAICTAVAGIPELIDDGVSGFLAAAPTIPLFEECLERMWHSRGSLRTMGEAARIAVRSKTPEDPVATFVDELLGLLARSSNK
jgi:glycosyltransferase involved in cell wall biosynthesis